MKLDIVYLKKIFGAVVKNVLVSIKNDALLKSGVNFGVFTVLLQSKLDLLYLYITDKIGKSIYK